MTLYGIVDASISSYANSSRDPFNGVTYNEFGIPVKFDPFYVNKGTVRTSARGLYSNGYSSSRLGFRGVEDLGGGLAASFVLEAPINVDDGSKGVADFTRRSTVSLSGAFGEFRLGRDYSPSFWNNTVFDPFGTNGVGGSLVQTATSAFGNPTRNSNTIGYFLPSNLGGFYGQVQYGFHENTKYGSGSYTPRDGSEYVLNPRTGRIESKAVAAANSRAGRYVGGRFGYANGPLDVAVAYGSSTVDDDFFGGTTDKVNTFNVGASYDFGVVKLFGELSQAKESTDYDSSVLLAPVAVTSTKLNGWLLGATMPVGAGLIRAAYSGVEYKTNNNNPFVNTPNPKANKLAIGYVHNLSKRTAVYATVARITNKDGADLTVGGPKFYTTGGFTPKSSTGYDFGIRHSF